MGKLSAMFENFEKEEKESPTKPKSEKSEPSPRPKQQPSKSTKKDQLAQEIIFKTDTVIEMLLNTWKRFKDTGSSHGNEMRLLKAKIEEYKKL